MVNAIGYLVLVGAGDVRVCLGHQCLMINYWREDV